MFRFTIRDLLWLMVVVGMALGWWLDHRWQMKFTAVTFNNGFASANIRPGQMIEVRALPGGTIETRTVPYRP